MYQHEAEERREPPAKTGPPKAEPRQAPDVPPTQSVARPWLPEVRDSPLGALLARAVEQRAAARLDRARTRPKRRGGGNKPLTSGQLRTVWKDVLLRRLEIAEGEASTLAELRGSGRVIDEVVRFYENKPERVSAEDVVTLLGNPARSSDAILALLAEQDGDRRQLSVAEVARLVDGTAGRPGEDVRALAQAKRTLSVPQIILVANGTAAWPIADALALVERRPQLTPQQIVALASLPGRALTDIVALLDHPLNMSPADVVSVARAGRSAGDMTTLQNTAASATTADLVLLASVAGLGMPELQVLAAAVATLPPGRTVADLVALATQTTRMLTPTQAVQLANVPNRTVSDLKDLLGHALGLPLAQVEAIGRSGRTAAEVTELTSAPLSLPAPDAIALASLPARTMDDVRLLAGAGPLLAPGRTIAELAGLAELGGATPTLTAQEAIDLAAVDRPLEDIRQLAAAKQSLIAGRTVADLVTLAKLGAVDDRRLTANGIVALLTAGGVPTTMTTTQLVTLIGHLKGIDGLQIKEIVNWLHPSLTVDKTTALCSTLKNDALDGSDIHAIIKAFADAGANGTVTEQRITNLRATYKLAETTDITTHQGKRVLTGQMLKLQIIRSLAAGPPALAQLAQKAALYPDGTNPAGRTHNQLWDDCDLNLPARAIGTRTETLDEQKIRQRLALNKLMTYPGYVDLRVQRIFENEEGRKPRDIELPDVEDTRSGGHIVTRHVLDGTGEIGDEEDLAMRALGFRPSPHSPAGAFALPADAKTGMQAALNSLLANPGTNWKWMRDKLARDDDPGDRVRTNINAAGVKMTSNVGVITARDLPPYSDPGGFGTRPLHDTDDYMTRVHSYWKYYHGDGQWYLTGYNGAWVQPYVPYAGFAPGAKLCTRNGAPRDVAIRILARDCEGGFAIHSAWPQ